MKMTRNDYQRLSKMIIDVLENNQGTQVIYKDKGLSDMRFRWDVYHHVIDNAQREGRIDDCTFFSGLYYLNDDNIDTALKSIVSGYNKTCIDNIK